MLNIGGIFAIACVVWAVWANGATDDCTKAERFAKPVLLMGEAGYKIAKNFSDTNPELAPEVQRISVEVAFSAQKLIMKTFYGKEEVSC